VSRYVVAEHKISKTRAPAGPDHAARPGPEPGGEPAPGRFIVFAIVCLALLMASVDQTIVATALPALQRRRQQGAPPDPRGNRQAPRQPSPGEGPAA